MSSGKYPCIKCDKNIVKNSKAVRCLFCELWIHQTCAGISDENYAFLEDQKAENGGHVWCCKSCKAGSYLFKKKLSELENKISDVKKSTESNAKSISEQGKAIGELQEDLNSMPLKITEDTSSTVFAEIQERESRRQNLIIHNLPEPATSITIGKERRDIDLQEVTKVLDRIKGPTAEEIKFCRRLGDTRKEDSSSTEISGPRPMLIGLRSQSARDWILNHTKDLINTEYNKLSICADLTARQRREEQDLKKEATRRNEAMPAEESLNWEWKLLGIRGQRKLVKVRKRREGQEQEGRPRTNNTQRKRTRPQRTEDMERETGQPLDPETTSPASKRQRSFT